MLLPIFPLELVVFPNESVNLHVFEPRYRELMKDCETDDIRFAIPLVRQKRIMPLVTAVKLGQIRKRYPNGRLDVTVIATKDVYKISRVRSHYPHKLYAAIEVEQLPSYSFDADPLLSLKILEHVKILYTLLNIDKPIPDTPNDVWTYKLGHYVGFSLAQEYKLLTIPDEQSRQEMMCKHLEKLIPMAEEAERLKAKTRLNGHFKDILSSDFDLS